MINLYNELQEYCKQDWYPYHMPGHKRQDKSGISSELRNLDITEIDGSTLEVFGSDTVSN